MFGGRLGGSALTLGGLPRFLFSPEGPAAEGSAFAVEVLFLLPFGRPRPRLAGVAGAAEWQSGSERGMISIRGMDGYLARRCPEPGPLRAGRRRPFRRGRRPLARRTLWRMC